MPIYEYECMNCGYSFEKLQKFSDAAVSSCPKCGGPVKKLVSHTSFQLKGSGWYLTDYARKNTPKSSSENGKNDSGDKSKAKTKGKSNDTDI